MNGHFSQYFRNLNRVGWIKWALVLAGAIATFIGTSTESFGTNSDESIKWAIPAIFIACCIIIPVGLKLGTIFYDIQIEWPSWNDIPVPTRNLYLNQKPLVAFDFAGVIFLFAGLSRLFAISVYHRQLDMGGLILLSGSIGVFIGIFLAVKWAGTDNQA
ncbi:MAG TPA: hypothetical protein VG367_09355 [Mucilaginibacter sp.]|jgi:hypothetical protein|nr:hypothetical protein [Mucilaginibacter sp.]